MKIQVLIAILLSCMSGFLVVQANTIVNGDFEGDALGAPPAEWTPFFTRSLSVENWWGGKALGLYSPVSEEYSGVFQEFSATAGESYTLSGTMYAPDLGSVNGFYETGNYGNMKLEFLSAFNVWTAYNEVGRMDENTVAGSVISFQGTFVAPQDTTLMRAVLGVYRVPTTSLGTTGFDNISLHRVPDSSISGFFGLLVLGMAFMRRRLTAFGR